MQLNGTSSVEDGEEEDGETRCGDGRQEVPICGDSSARIILSLPTLSSIYSAIKLNTQHYFQLDINKVNKVIWTKTHFYALFQAVNLAS